MQLFVSWKLEEWAADAFPPLEERGSLWLSCGDLLLLSELMRVINILFNWANKWCSCFPLKCLTSNKSFFFQCFQSNLMVFISRSSMKVWSLYSTKYYLWAHDHTLYKGVMMTDEHTPFNDKNHGMWWKDQSQENLLKYCRAERTLHLKNKAKQKVWKII